MSAVIVMRIDLGGPHAGPSVWPAGFELRDFDRERHVGPARALLNAAYADGGGMVCDAQAWWSDVSGDPEFDAALCLPVFDASSERMVAFAHCWTSGFVKDIAVAIDHRGRGLGAALMKTIFRVFQARGLGAVSLKVTADNPTGAPAFYERLGMRRVEA